MAQEVRYFENDVAFAEGPFVIVNACGWRIECELKGYICPILPDCSIYRLYQSEFHCELFKTTHGKATIICDWLNWQVREGRIVQRDKFWYCMEFIHPVVKRRIEEVA